MLRYSHTYRFFISIHALLAESDQRYHRQTADRRHFYPRSPCGERPADIASFAGLCNFYPRSPCGERHVPFTMPDLGKGFLSTLSLRRATPTMQRALGVFSISIHALLAESDPLVNMRKMLSPVFLSTLSLRRATCKDQTRAD